MQADSMDSNPRPLKRQRVDGEAKIAERDALDPSKLNPIPPAHLLLALPSLLVHPPTHSRHQFSLELSLTALKNALDLEDIGGDMECRAWTAFAEVSIVKGIRDSRIADEVEKAIAKALLLAQKHPSLRFYKPHLSLMSARMANDYQNNPKFAIQTVRRLLNSFSPSDPPHLVYAAHLALISHSETESPMRLLDAIQNFHNLAVNNGHPNIALLAQVIRVRTMLREGLWQDVGQTLKDTEEEFHLNFQDANARPNIEEPTAKLCLRLHLLILGVVYYTYAGEAASASLRLTKLHELLDKGALNKLGETGIVKFSLSGSKPLYVHMTHPQVLHLLTFLVSSVSQRNPSGRNPKRRVFAVEGLAAMERGLRQEIALPIWASQRDANDVYATLHEIKADMLSELAANSICRNEFDDAEKHLNTLIAHTRSTSLFPMYAARITLHHAHLAHSLGQTERALECYCVAAHLSRPRMEVTSLSNDPGESCPRTPRKRTASPTKRPGQRCLRSLSRSPRKRKSSISPTKKRSLHIDEDEQYPEDIWIYTTARAGEIWLRLGLARGQARSEEHNMEHVNERLEELAAQGEAIADECEGLGGALRTIADVLRSCLSQEVLKSKGHLRTAIELASVAQDNHLRALIIALISAHYFHTAPDHAEKMLLTCEQLAAGLGAQPRAPANRTDTGRLPLTTSDSINMARDESQKGAGLDTPPKPNKRKAIEVDEENHNPSPGPSKKHRPSISDSSPWGHDNVGNVQLRLWVAERFLELSRWSGNVQRVKMQEEKVQNLRGVARSIGTITEVC